MKVFQVIRSHVVFGNHALIKTIKKEAQLSEPVYAINWFNTRFKWMYDFYNILAVRSVYKIGGKVFFKGDVVKTLSGSDEDSREVLLIVNYPSGNDFLGLVKDKYFLLVSILREVAVKQFSFGFTQRLDSSAPLLNGKRSFDSSKAYAFHHFKTDRPIPAFTSIIKRSAEPQGIKVEYAGQTSSLLFSQNRAGKETQVPCLLDGLFLFESDAKIKLEEFLNSPDYKEVVASFDSSYIALLKRTL
jgi:uncharacterized protein (DUF1330 family)